MTSSKFATASLIALAALSAGTAFAADGSTGLTREQVHAEYLAARAAGTLPVIGEVGLSTVDVKSNQTRAQVRADYFQAVKDGTLPVTGEVAVSIQNVATTPSTKTRAEVRADYFKAVKNGTLPRFEG